MLSFTTAAVTEGEADAYATARLLAAWTGTSAAKVAALRRGQDYIAGTYNGRWTYVEADGDYVEWTTATAPTEVKYAIIEAAIREIADPGVLAPDITPGDKKVLTGVKGITWQPMGDGSSNSYRPVVAAIEALLIGLVTGSNVGNTTDFLARA